MAWLALLLTILGIICPESVGAQSAASRSFLTCELRFLEPRAVTGIVGSDSLWFGRIGGLAVAVGSPVLFISDVLQHQVLRIDLGQRRFRRIGRDGEGPGEFRVPTALAVAGDMSFWVYDAVLRRLSHFDIEGEYLSDFRLPFPVMGAVSLEVDRLGDLYLSGYAVASPFDGYLIHKFTPKGVHVASFAENPELDNVVDPRHHGGALALASSGQTVWFSPSGPALLLQEYSLDGVLRRSIKFETQHDLDMNTDQVESRGGEIRLIAHRRMGSIAIVRLPEGVLVNVANVDPTGTMQFDVVDEGSGKAGSSWRGTSPVLAAGDGVKYVFAVDVAGSEIWRQGVVCESRDSRLPVRSP